MAKQKRPSSPDYQAVVSAPFGSVGIMTNGSQITGIELLPAGSKPKAAENPLAADLCSAIEHYLLDPKSPLDLQLQLQGTDFQRRVWRRMMKIPVGSAVTYGQIAEEFNTSPRAVGNACRANPCPLLIPCHRVVGKNGLGGFAGRESGPKLALKRWLLHHEGWL